MTEEVWTWVVLDKYQKAQMGGLLFLGTEEGMHIWLISIRDDPELGEDFMRRFEIMARPHNQQGFRAPFYYSSIQTYLDEYGFELGYLDNRDDEDRV